MKKELRKLELEKQLYHEHGEDWTHPVTGKVYKVSRRKPRKRCLYQTSQFFLKEGEQYRITHNRRTIFVYANKSGLHISKGGYCPKKV
jgi:hypothetical protein